MARRPTRSGEKSKVIPAKCGIHSPFRKHGDSLDAVENGNLLRTQMHLLKHAGETA